MQHSYANVARDLIFVLFEYTFLYCNMYPRQRRSCKNKSTDNWEVWFMKFGKVGGVVDAECGYRGLVLAVYDHDKKRNMIMVGHRGPVMASVEL